MMRDPCLLPHHLHLPTAYIYLQFAPRHILFYEHRHSKLAFSVPAPLCYPQHKCATVHLCISVHSQKINYEELQDCRSEMDSWSSSHARARHFSCHQEEWLSAECHSYNVPLHPSGALISAQPLLRAVAEVKW